MQVTVRDRSTRLEKGTDKHNERAVEGLQKKIPVFFPSEFVSVFHQFTVSIFLYICFLLAVAKKVFLFPQIMGTHR